MAAAPGRLQRAMQDPLPVIVLGRLAVHQGWAGHGIGSGLSKDAVLRALQASQIIGARALLRHAIDDDAGAPHLRHGFVESPSISLNAAPMWPRRSSCKSARA